MIYFLNMTKIKWDFHRNYFTFKLDLHCKINLETFEQGRITFSLSIFCVDDMKKL